MSEIGEIRTAEEIRDIIRRDIGNMDLDEEIRDAVIAFNEAGYATLESCAGHGKRFGYIEFMDCLEKGDLEHVLTAIGFSDVTILHDGDEVWFKGGGTLAVFDPVGK